MGFLETAFYCAPIDNLLCKWFDHNWEYYKGTKHSLPARICARCGEYEELKCQKQEA